MRRHNKNHLGPASPPADSSVPSAVPFPAIITIRPPPKHGLTLQSSTTSGALESHPSSPLSESDVTHPETDSPPAHSSLPSASTDFMSSSVPESEMIAISLPPQLGPPLQGSTASRALETIPSSPLTESSITQPESTCDTSAHRNVVTFPSTSHALDVPCSGLEQHLSESLQRRNQNIREKMAIYKDVCREIGYSPVQINRNTGIIAGQLYLPSPVTSTPNSLNPQSSSSSATASRPLESNSQCSEGLPDLTLCHDLTLQVSTTSPSSSSSFQESGVNSMLQSTSSSETFTKCVQCSSESVTMISTATQAGQTAGLISKYQCKICFRIFKNKYRLTRHMGDLHTPRYKIFLITISLTHVSFTSVSSDYPQLVSLVLCRYDVSCANERRFGYFKIKSSLHFGLQLV